MPWILTGTVPVHVKFVPPLHRQVETEYSKVLKEAGRIVSRKNTPESETSALLQRLKPHLSGQEKDEVRGKLKRRISTELKAGGISRKERKTTTMVFVNLLMEGIEMTHTGTGASIILYVKCGSVESLFSLREMIRVGVLLRLLSDSVEQFNQSRIGIYLVVRAKDYNLCLSYLSSVPGKFANLQSIE